MNNNQLEKRDLKSFNFFLEYRDFMEFKSHDKVAESFKPDLDIKLKIPYVIFDRDLKQNSIHMKVYSNTFNIKHTERKKRGKKAPIAICVKDNPKILKLCLTKLKEINADSEFDIIVVDDRSKTQDIQQLAEEYDTHYIRVDNEINIFNYSMLNNIAAAFSSHLGYEDMICWNSDMWAEDLSCLLNIYQQHKDNNVAVTGARLLYPTKEEYEKYFSDYHHVLGDHIAKAFNTIQHGGIEYDIMRGVVEHKVILPLHSHRFAPADTPDACRTKITSAVTGALHVLNLEIFKTVGGYNPSLVNSFQDIDYCQKVTTTGFKVLYVGEEKLYHAESITNNSEGNISTPYALSDRILYELLWPNKTNFDPDSLAHDPQKAIEEGYQYAKEPTTHRINLG